MMTRAIVGSLAVCLSACGENRTIPSKDAYVAPAVAPLTCLPNLDGKIEASELQAAIGIPVRYLASPPGASAAGRRSPGRPTPQGQRVWDLSIDYADDRVATLEASTVSGHWFAASFPDGQWVAALDLGGTMLGVYSHRRQRPVPPRLRLARRSAGQRQDAGRLQPAGGDLPLPAGDGEAVGQRGPGEQRHRARAALRGPRHLPGARRRRRASSSCPTSPSPRRCGCAPPPPSSRPSATPSCRRQVGWVFECFGEVARATAPDNELNDDFTTTAELRRLGL